MCIAIRDVFSNPETYANNQITYAEGLVGENPIQLRTGSKGKGEDLFNDLTGIFETTLYKIHKDVIVIGSYVNNGNSQEATEVREKCLIVIEKWKELISKYLEFYYIRKGGKTEYRDCKNIWCENYKNIKVREACTTCIKYSGKVLEEGRFRELEGKYGKQGTFRTVSTDEFMAWCQGKNEYTKDYNVAIFEKIKRQLDECLEEQTESGYHWLKNSYDVWKKYEENINRYLTPENIIYDFIDIPLIDYIVEINANSKQQQQQYLEECVEVTKKAMEILTELCQRIQGILCICMQQLYLEEWQQDFNVQ